LAGSLRFTFFSGRKAASSWASIWLALPYLGRYDTHGFLGLVHQHALIILTCDHKVLMNDEARAFEFDEVGYLNWLSAHPGGWVVNVPRRRGGVALRHCPASGPLIQI
jgi:hypothetical protein